MGLASAAESTLTPARANKPGKWRLRKNLVYFALVAVLLWGGWRLVQMLTGSNLHVVIPGKLYRSAQLSPGVLEQVVKEHGIRTVVNTRGCGPYMQWYMGESKTTCRLDICQEDVHLSAARVPSRTELRRIIEILDHAERPILVHCRRGADRTGLVSVVALLLQDDVSYREARGQLSVAYGHLSLGKTARMGLFFDCYHEWLHALDREHTPANFRHWALHVYQGVMACRFESCSMPAKPIRAGQPFTIKVSVRNIGSKTWHFRPTKSAGVHLLCTIKTLQEKKVGRCRAGFFAAQVRPGEKIDLEAALEPIDKPGTYRLIIDMMDETMGEFFQFGSEPIIKRVRVRGREREVGSQK